MPESLHPLARILLWCGWVVGVELVSLPILYSMAVVSATAFVFARLRHAALRLLYRSRWLMLVLLLTYSYTLPGHSFWPELGWASPTIEGLQGGLVRTLRLSLILVALAVLLASTQRERLIYGLYSLARPLTVLGFDRRAFAVRLGLTLDYVEAVAAKTPSNAKQWLRVLREPLALPEMPTVYSLTAEQWKVRDSVALAAVGSLLVALL